MAPILTNIETQIAVLIDGMTVVGGFNFDWGISNEDDLAIKNKYPNAEIFVVAEEGDDEDEMNHAEAYGITATVEIHVTSKLTSADKNPKFTINAKHNLALDDLKKLFGGNQHLNNTANVILYRSMDRDPKPGGDR